MKRRSLVKPKKPGSPSAVERKKKADNRIEDLALHYAGVMMERFQNEFRLLTKEFLAKFKPVEPPLDHHNDEITHLDQAQVQQWPPSEGNQKS